MSERRSEEGVGKEGLRTRERELGGGRGARRSPQFLPPSSSPQPLVRGAVRRGVLLTRTHTARDGKESRVVIKSRGESRISPMPEETALGVKPPDGPGWRMGREQLRGFGERASLC